MASHSYILLCLCAASQVTTLQSHRIQGIVQQGGFQLAANDLLDGAGALQAASDLVGGKEGTRELFKSVLHEVRDAMLNDVSNSCNEKDAICNFLDRMSKSPEKVALIAIRLYTLYSGITAAWPTDDWATEIRDSLKLSGWGVFDEMCSDEYKKANCDTTGHADTSTPYCLARAQWYKTWDDWFLAAPAARTSFEGGNNTAWLPVFRQVSVGITDTLKHGSPNNNETWDIVQTSMNSSISGWESWAEGNVALAIGQVWTALYALVEPVFGLDPNSPTGKVLASTDIVMSIATTELQNYETKKDKDKAFTESSKADAVGFTGFLMCYPRTYTRKSKPVSQCYWGFTYDAGSGHCIAQAEHGADCQSACSGSLNKACPSFCPIDKRYCCKKGEAGSPFECSEARYVDLAFAVGAPTDYYQCVSPALSVANANLQELQTSLLEEKGSASSAMLERAKAGANVRTRASLDRSASGKGESGPAAVTNGNAKPVCDPNSLYTEILADYPGQCYEKCPTGYTPEVKKVDDKDVEQTTCLQGCEAVDDGRRFTKEFGITFTGGDTPLSSPVCSTSNAVIDDANNNALGKVTDGMTELINTAVKISGGDTLTDAELSKFVQDMATMINHFALPSCGEEHVPPS